MPVGAEDQQPFLPVVVVLDEADGVETLVLVFGMLSFAAAIGI